uniref:PDZ domain-containing protein n=1 Tax=Oryza punctata TaxID=4537 RepID=A0A0E0KAM5_ORYPU
MAPTTTKEKVGKVSGSRSSAERRRRQRKRQRQRQRQRQRRQQEAEAAATSPGTWHASSSSTEASSVVSSPLRWPSAPVITIRPGCQILERFDDPAIEDAYKDLQMKYHAKIERQLKLVTLDPYIPQSCMSNANLLAVRDSSTKTVLEGAKVVLGLSSYVDGTLMARSSGFFINWDEESKVGTVLTSARLICSKHPSMDQWLGSDEYSPNATVCAHLLDKDETTVPAALLHYDRHFNIALFKVVVDSCAKIPSFSSEVIYGQDIFALGRDGDLNLTINHGHVKFKGPSRFQRHYYMYTGFVTDQSSIGGPIINFNGQVLGMTNVPGMGFIPSSIILHCLDLWKNCIPRLHIGMKLSAMKFLDPIHVEKISRKCNVDSGLIVKEVSYGSTAEKLGVRAGNIIQSINGKCVATTVELENELMQICENHLDKGSGIGSSVDIQVGIFRMCKGSTCTVSLRLNVSDDVEIFNLEGKQQHDGVLVRKTTDSSCNCQDDTCR